MSNVRCSMSFHKEKVNDFPVFAGGVRDGVYGNTTTFATPPIGELDFQVALTAYNDTRYAYEQGGKAQKGPWLDAKNVLMDMLDQLAEYVDVVALGNANIITLAGYVPTKGNRSEAVTPAEPTGVTIKRGSSGTLLVECASQDNAISYGCIMTAKEPLPPNVVLNSNGQMVFADDGKLSDTDGQAEATNTGLVQGVIDFKPGRKKKFNNLTPGVIYYFVFYAANTKGVSPFSVPVSLMCG